MNRHRNYGSQKTHSDYMTCQADMIPTRLAQGNNFKQVIKQTNEANTNACTPQMRFKLERLELLPLLLLPLSNLGRG